MKLGVITVKSKANSQFWENYLRVMQSVLPHSQQLTPKELEILSLSIVESLTDSRQVFEPAIVKILAKKLSLTEYAIRMHRKNIRNKGWVNNNSLEALSAKIVETNPDEIELTIKIAR